MFPGAAFPSTGISRGKASSDTCNRHTPSPDPLAHTVMCMRQLRGEVSAKKDRLFPWTQHTDAPLLWKEHSCETYKHIKPKRTPQLMGGDVAAG